MRVHFLSVGKPRDDEVTRLFERYTGRIRQLGIETSQVQVPEVRAGGRYTEEHARRREAAALLERLPRGRRAIALDPTGRSLSSERWAENIARWLTPEAWWIVGGPSGLHPDLLERCELRLSLSPLTFPHELARAIAAEQVYRALTIRRGFPYHK